jgi:hypothetical protein
VKDLFHITDEEQEDSSEENKRQLFQYSTETVDVRNCKNIFIAVTTNTKNIVNCKNILAFHLGLGLNPKNLSIPPDREF